MPTRQARKKETLSDKILGYGAILVLCACVGGVIGFLSQTGVWRAFITPPRVAREARRRHFEKVTEPVPRETYHYRTRLGWWIGFGTGAAFGVSIVVATTRKRRRLRA